MDNMAKALAAGYPPLCMAQAHRNLLCVLFSLPCPALYLGQEMSTANIPPALQRPGLCSGRAGGGEGDYTSSKLILEYH